MLDKDDAVQHQLLMESSNYIRTHKTTGENGDVRGLALFANGWLFANELKAFTAGAIQPLKHELKKSLLVQ